MSVSRVRIDLLDGRAIEIGGDALAELVVASEPFRRAAGQGALPAIALMTAYAGTEDGVAARFHRALRELGHELPVYAPTTEIDVPAAVAWRVFDSLPAANSSRWDDDDDALSQPDSDGAWSMAGVDSVPQSPGWDERSVGDVEVPGSAGDVEAPSPVTDVAPPRSISLADFLGGTPPREENQ